MDKKLKNAADKIRMPEDMKQRIISAAELAEKNHVNTDNDGYIEVVSSAERVDPRRGIIRTISAIAACAVLVGGIGTTGFLLHRQNSTQMSGSEVSGTECRSCPFGDFREFDYSFDAGDGKYGRYSAETYAKLSDFLNKFNWGEEIGDPEIEANDKYLKFKEGDSEYVYDDRLESLNDDELIYTIAWNTSEGYRHINIVKGGYVSYTDFSNHIATDGVSIIIDSRCYNIDFDAFNRGVQEILAQADAPTPFGDFSKLDYILNANDAKYGELSDDVRANLSDFLNNFNWGEEISDDQLSEEEKNRSQMNLHSLEWRSEDKAYGLAVMEIGYAVYNVQKVTNVKGYGEVLKPESVQLYRVDFEAFDRGLQAVLNNESGDLISAELRVNNKSGDDIIISPESAEVKGYLENFLRNEFIPMLKSDIYAEGSDDIRYTVVMNYKVNKNTTLRKSYYICGDGFVNLCEYEVTGMEEVPAGCENFTIDFAEFESYLKKYGINAESSTETFESADLVFEQHETLTPTDEEDKAKFDAFVCNDFVKMLEPTKSDDIVGNVQYSIFITFKLDDNKMRKENYFIFTDGFVECNEYKTDEKGEMQLTNTEKYKIDVDKLESVLKDEIGVELPEYREININKAD
ncbi:hypothetical protein [uncultured Ruminococcus sp.]|uniref:hypothetical protein n=1 Tax=uncultured Ruminococcus sp. TaxID=165186 RepID=UPI0025E7058D|nr:hypothetical protein [uncultured Ruminococcus sp.]